MIRLLNNLIIKQFQLRKENDLINTLEEQFRELLAMDDMTGKEHSKDTYPEYTKKMNECLKHIQQLKKDFRLDLALLEANTFELQEEIFTLRMLPMDLIFGSIPKMVEETAMVLDKEIDFTITGHDVMIDKIILEKLNDPIIHLIRNAVDHGIEFPDERIKKGKPKVGTLEIKCYLESGNIIIKITDDGKGVDYDRIREKAIKEHPEQEDEIMMMENASLNAYLFTSGFSTRDVVQELSGRGVGLNIVKYNIENIKGRINLSSEKDKGTEFTLSLPLSLATVEGFFITSAGEKFLIPSTYVKEVLIVKKDQHVPLGQKHVIILRDKIIPIYYLSVLLAKKDAPEEDESEKRFIMVIESLGNMIGIVVDSIIQYASLIYKPLPPNLNKLKLIQGIVFDESYNIINILFIPEVMERFRRMRPRVEKTSYPTKNTQEKTILVVDDSYSTREIERSILEVENYKVVTASNGKEALEKLSTNPIDLVISDINMPIMNGLELVENIRKTSNFSSMPVVVVSSEEDPDIRKRFTRLGVASQIVKSDFERGNLVQTVQEVIGVAR
ncbi:MAG: Chemotaxis protein cheA [Candidatus Magnetoglobus multicellularis str. Araruama]|uniref:histidine kinase n=1 Tax=Candidatus Magnetoglobus multicellularis str. Araruama TaxID=890399 RepID=A0A1V1P8P1_9BACT|nr:MAG: Chemotaxis protein cheA [Candidatus Magnetoglobus multicellularis str. Araruama]